MKRTLYIVCVLLLTLSLLTGCGSSENVRFEKTEQPKVRPQTPEAAASVYQSVLVQYRQAVAQRADSAALSEAGLSSLCALCYESGVENGIGYLLYDLDGNGSLELSIGAISGDSSVEKQLFAVYTQLDGQALPLLCGNSENRYYLCNDGNIAWEGDNDAEIPGSSRVCVIAADGTLRGTNLVANPENYIQIDFIPLSVNIT